MDRNQQVTLLERLLERDRTPVAWLECVAQLAKAVYSRSPEVWRELEEVHRTLLGTYDHLLYEQELADAASARETIPVLDRANHHALARALVHADQVVGRRTVLEIFGLS